MVVPLAWRAGFCVKPSSKLTLLAMAAVIKSFLHDGATVGAVTADARSLVQSVGTHDPLAEPPPPNGSFT